MKKVSLSKKEIEDIILWARTWAEYVSDEDVLKMWYKGTGIVKVYGEREFDLSEVKFEIDALNDEDALSGENE